MTIQFKLPIEYVTYNRISNDITDNIDSKSIYLKRFQTQKD